jgi:hypothetical protein
MQNSHTQMIFSPAHEEQELYKNWRTTGKTQKIVQLLWVDDYRRNSSGVCRPLNKAATRQLFFSLIFKPLRCNRYILAINSHQATSGFPSHRRAFKDHPQSHSFEGGSDVCGLEVLRGIEEHSPFLVVSWSFPGMGAVPHAPLFFSVALSV